MSLERKAEAFVEALQRAKKMPGVFNPWRDIDRENDASRSAPEIRAGHLVRYLTERAGRATHALIAEAPGFQGCHFSGVPMTSERILLGHLRHKGIATEHVFEGPAERTSKLGPKTPALGANEPTATIVWGAVMAAGACPRSVVLWNTFAFHPMADGYLTNRRPTRAELDKAAHLLEQFIDLFPGAQILPVGRIAEETFASMEIECSSYIRHPANGGATEFRQGLSRYLSGSRHSQSY